tara:strand:+ start:50 stop:322 length:273 start_codon:yes stop_codon:yes gene_type:complete
MYKLSKVLEELNNKNIGHWEDCSEPRDLCQSVYNEDKWLQIFLPNSLEQNEDNEEWNTYQLCSIKDWSECDYILQNATLDEIINYIGKDK